MEVIGGSKELQNFKFEYFIARYTKLLAFQILIN